VLERELAARAGVGRVGKHTLVLRPGEGSYLLLGEVLMTLDIPTTPSSMIADPCGACTQCIDACPTRAIEAFSVDASKCLAYTTIEHRGTIKDELQEQTGDWLFGCDVCQEVCPHNEPTRRNASVAVASWYAPRQTDFDLLSVLGWTESDRQSLLVRSALRRAQLSMWKRNALVCLGNALTVRRDDAIIARMQAVADDALEDDLVRATARRVLERLSQRLV